MKHSKIIAIIAAVIVFTGFAVFALSRNQEPEKPKSLSDNGKLTVTENNYDFGAISMKKGTVTHTFKLKNEGSEPVNLSRLYTSCMCTTAKLITAAGSEGPFGMQGHGFVPYISRDLAPGEEAELEVVFDPAAHGPAGVGQISRAVILENNTRAGALQVSFSATVTP